MRNKFIVCFINYLLMILILSACGSKGSSGSGGGTNNNNQQTTGNSYKVGGNVSGMSGRGLVLQNNGADDLPISASGAFTFPSKITDGAAYAVTVKTQPSNPAQNCTVGNGSGSVSGADVTSVIINCSDIITGTSVFTAAANPLNITLNRDEAHAVSATIPLSGGKIEATGADGIKYTLVIPANALAQEIEITMTPVKSITGLTFSNGLGGVVALEPEGLYLYKDAILSITPATTIPINNQIMFGFDADGKDVHLAMPVVSSNDIQIRLEHFSGAGVGNGVSAEKAAILNRLADSAENRLTSQMADALSRERQRQLLGSNDEGNLADMANEAFTSFENEVLKPRIKAAMSASATCADGKRAIASLLGWERQRQLLGVSDDSSNLVEAMGLVDAVGRKCADEEYKICAEQHNILRIIPFALGVERQMQLLGVVDTATPDTELTRYIWSLVEKCLRFELQFESDAHYDDGVCCGYQSGVTSKVPIRMEKAGSILALNIKGSAPLVNTNFNWIPFDDCSVTNERGGGTFDASSLLWEYKESVLKDFKLTYFPGKTSEAFTEVCKDITIPRTQSSYWTNVYIVTHSDECDTGGACFISKNWTVQNAELMGKKEWNKKFIGEGWTDEEYGSMKLYHRPGQ